MRLRTAEDTAALARELAQRIQPGDVIALSGEVGAGKTTFAQAFITPLLKTPEPVTSPTFTLVQIYDTMLPWRLLHADLYRLKHAGELAELGIEEMFDTHVSLIEWPEIAAPILPEHALHLTLSHSGQDSREAILYSEHERWQEFLKTYE